MRALLIASTAIAACFPSVVYAQDAENPEPETSELALGEVVVTAQRREESLQKAAVAVSVLSSEDLEAARLTEASGLSIIVPALQTQTSGAFTNFFIRGVGTPNANGYTDPGVATNFDGIYISRATSIAGLFFDLQRVEVLKGPQGTLYGRNATGGAVNILPNQPRLGEFGGTITGELGNYDLKRGEGAVNMPLGERAALRVSGQWIDRAGYMDDGTDDDESYASRAQLLVEPNDMWSLRFSADYAQRDGHGGGGTISSAANPIVGPAGVTGYTLDPSGIPARAGNASNAANAYFTSRLLSLGNTAPTPNQPSDSFQDNTFWGIHLQSDLETPVGTLTIVPAYRSSSLDMAHTASAFWNRQLEDAEQTSLEVRLSSDTDGPLDYIFGAYYIDESIEANYVFNNQSVTPFQDLETGTTSTAVFGRLNLDVSPTFRLSGGARYTEDSKYFDGTSFVVFHGCAPFPFGAPTLPCPNGVTAPNVDTPGELGFGPPQIPLFPIPGTTTNRFAVVIPVDRELEDSAVTWRVGADWDVADNSLLYASYETGYHSGGFFFTADDPTFDAETIDAFTVGWKNRFFNERLQLNLETFYWQYEDQQVSHVSQDSTGALVFITENVGESYNRGFEIETRYLASANTLLSADIQYLDAEYEEFVYSAPNQGVPPVTGCPFTLAPGGATYSLDCSGQRPPNAPEWVVNLGAAHTIPLGNGGSLTAKLRTHYQSESLAGVDQLPNQIQDAYWMSNFGLTYETPDGKIQVTGFVNNIEDEDVVTEFAQHSTLLTYSAKYLAPRTYGVRLKYNFGE